MKTSVIFMRHAKTRGNISHLEKGAKFLGRKNDLGMILPEKEKINSHRNGLKNTHIVFSSPLKRCLETVKIITDKPIKKDKKLLEIDYGEFDGIYLKDARKKYPKIFSSWEKGVDIKFPKGENYEDLLKRIERFQKELLNYTGKNILVCTHNVVLRALIGKTLNIKQKDWFKIKIPHFEPIKFSLENGKLIYLGSEKQKKALIGELYHEEFKPYLITLTPEEKLYSKILDSKLKIAEKFGNQKYLYDSPHLTLYILLAKNQKEIIKKIKKISKKKKQINFKIEKGYLEFERDSLARGGTSVAISFDEKANQKIKDLQKEIVNELNELRKEKIYSRYFEADLNGKLKENVQKYGFPFVGKILIPHINFCSFFPPEIAKKFTNENSILKFGKISSFHKISLYKIEEGEKIKLIEEFKLK